MAGFLRGAQGAGPRAEAAELRVKVERREPAEALRRRLPPRGSRVKSRSRLRPAPNWGFPWVLIWGRWFTLGTGGPASRQGRPRASPALREGAGARVPPGSSRGRGAGVLAGREPARWGPAGSWLQPEAGVQPEARVQPEAGSRRKRGSFRSGVPPEAGPPAGPRGFAGLHGNSRGRASRSVGPCGSGARRVAGERTAAPQRPRPSLGPAVRGGERAPLDAQAEAGPRGPRDPSRAACPPAASPARGGRGRSCKAPPCGLSPRRPQVSGSGLSRAPASLRGRARTLSPPPAPPNPRRPRPADFLGPSQPRLLLPEPSGAQT